MIWVLNFVYKAEALLINPYLTYSIKSQRFYTQNGVNYFKSEIMSTKEQLEKDIQEISSTISKKYPELLKYVSEIPESNSESEEVNIKSLKDYYLSLKDIVNKYGDTHASKNNSKDKEKFPGYPHQPASEDIYSKSKEESNLNPEDPSKKKVPVENLGDMNEKSFQEDMSGADLDVPGSELDDQMENIGSEDEENNYYSLGGDNHNDLEEDKG